MNDLRIGWRLLWKNPGFTAVAVLTLALGLSANTAVFGIISTFFFQPLPVKAADRLVMLMQKSGIWSFPHGHSWRDYQDYREQVTEFEDALALFMSPVHLAAEGQAPERTWIEAVSGNYFSMLGVEPAVGSLFAPGVGERPGADPYVVLSHAYWQRRFGGDRTVIGRTVQLNGRPFTVIGVTGPVFTGAQWSIAVSAWVPAMMLPQLVQGGEGLLNDRGAPAFKVLARLKPDATLARARASARLIGQQLHQAYPKEHREATILVMPERRCRPEPTFSEFIPFAAAAFMAMVGLVLFIACANVANLMFARALVRQREMGIRAAIGASRWRLIRQLLTESMLLGLLAGGLGLVLAHACGRLLAGFTPAGDMPLNTDQAWDWRVFAFTFGLSVLAGAVTGLAPALRATRFDLQSTLKEGGTAILSSRRHRFRSGLVISQVALSLVVLVCGGLFLQSLGRAARLDLGFRPERLVMASLDLGLQGYDDERGRQFVTRLLERTRALPGVEAATVAGSVPFDYGVQLRDVGAEGRITDEGPGKDGFLVAGYNAVEAAYHRTLGAPLVKGREFTSADRADTVRVVIINQTLAERLWPGEEALGKRLRLGRDGEFHEVVGVARDGKYILLGEEPRPHLYVPLEQHYASPVTLHARTAGEPLAQASALRKVLADLDPNLPIYNVRSMEEHIRTSAMALMPLRMAAVMAAVQGGLGLILAVMGLYGVVAYSVSQRTREIGIRLALGARRLDVLRLVVREGWRLTAIGLGLGLVMALGIAPVLARLLYGLNPLNVPVFALVLLLLAGVASLACYWPARRATRVDPMVALRCE